MQEAIDWDPGLGRRRAPFGPLELVPSNEVVVRCLDCKLAREILARTAVRKTMKGFEELNAKLEAATSGLSGITRKRVFGRNTFFVDGKLFSLVWREGRIGLKIPNAEAHAELSSAPGSTPWVAWGRPMAGWLLVPVTMHLNPTLLASWVKRACDAVRAAAPAPAAETVAARVEPIPGHGPLPKISTAPKAASAAPPKTNGATAPSVPAPAGETASGGEFSFDEEPASSVEPTQAAIAAREPSAKPPVPSATPAFDTPADASGTAEAEADAFSFDAPQVEAPPAEESSREAEAAEFEFGGSEPEPPPAAANEASTKKKKGKGGRKKTG